MAAIKLRDAKAGDKLPTLEFGPISRQLLALYAGASGDHNPVHIDIDFAKAAGLPDVFAHGMLSFGVLSRVVTEWCGIGQLRSLEIRFASVTQVHDRIHCSAEVTEIIEMANERCLGLVVTAATSDGRVTLSGQALVAIPVH